ncbi:MAG: NAD-dependent epimerase/dehydratase family protein [Micromonosporaceae bacterium]|nr:NAD-dependent epimerase/dehydratase family protein [Micromonosporaceae bacterium]
MVAVVTGGAGYIGTNLAAALAAAGHRVRVVDLREPVTAKGLGAYWVRADVRDPAAMRRAFDGAEVVYHLAGLISVAGPLGGRVASVNVAGARVVAEAALATGVGRLVHCSSVHAFDVAARPGTGNPPEPVDEDAPRSTDPLLPAYDRSKAAGEAEVRRVVQRGLDAVVVNPTAVLGPADEAPSRVGAVLLAMWRGLVPAVPAGGFDWVDIRDVVAALRAAQARGVTGESYLVTGTRLSARELAAHAAAVDRRAWTARVMPDWPLRAVAPAATLLVRWSGRWSGSGVLPTAEALQALHTFPVVSGQKAAAQLGHHPRPIEQTLTDLHAWYIRNGRLRRR